MVTLADPSKSFLRLSARALAFFEIVATATTVYLQPSSTVVAPECIFILGWLGYLCERKELVFRNTIDLGNIRLSLRQAFQWDHLRPFAYLAGPVALQNYVLSDAAPQWFPTDHVEWVLLPFAAFCILAVNRGWLVSHTGHSP